MPRRKIEEEAGYNPVALSTAARGPICRDVIQERGWKLMPGLSTAARGPICRDQRATTTRRFVAWIFQRPLGARYAETLPIGHRVTRRVSFNGRSGPDMPRHADARALGKACNDFQRPLGARYAETGRYPHARLRRQWLSTAAQGPIYRDECISC